jgi:hypothetical protein
MKDDKKVQKDKRKARVRNQMQKASRKANRK